ncbi:hypothetical protein BGZ88_007065 [Linnemannia elongata]|nr:hypothetical protein BGZ88_007065 [Linnemannia elongata]
MDKFRWLESSDITGVILRAPITKFDALQLWTLDEKSGMDAEQIMATSNAALDRIWNDTGKTPFK